MNILIITRIFPPNRRIELEAQSLMEVGHKIFLMARRTLDQTKDETVNRINVIRYPLPFQKKKAISDFIHFFFQRYFIFFQILIVCRRHRIDALHVHNLPCSLAVSAAGRILGIPVVFDMREHYTAVLREEFKSNAYWKYRLFSFFLLGPLRIDEKIACRWSTKIIVVDEAHIPIIRKIVGADDKIKVVTNTEDPDDLMGFGIDNSICVRFRENFVILYFGKFDSTRGLDTAIRSMPRVLEKIPDALLLLVGDGTNRNELEQLAMRMQLGDRIVFTGYQNFSKITSYISVCDIGLLPFHSTPHIETTMANKFFQFMTMGKAIIASDVKPMMRIINETKCGLIFRDRDPNSLAEAIIKSHDKKLRLQLGENGHQAVIRRYNWRETARALIGIYSEL